MVEISLTADSYVENLRAMEELYIDRPDRAPLLTLGAIVVGPRGVGKTALLLKLLVDMRKGGTYYPVYISGERYLSKISSEGQKLEGVRNQERLQELAGAVSLAVAQAILNSFQNFPLGADSEALPSWIRSEVQGAVDLKQADAWLTERIRDVVENRVAQVTPLRVPPLIEVAAHFGRFARSQGRQLVVLIDQLDDLAPFIYPDLVQLFARGQPFLPIVAMRPCPTAPGSLALPPGFRPGDNFEPVYIGLEAGSEAWGRFLLSVASRLELRPEVSMTITKAIASIAPLFVSVRSFIAFATRMEAEFGLGRTSEAALNKAFESVCVNEEALARIVLTSFGGDPGATLKEWRRIARVESGVPYRPTHVKLSYGALLSPSAHDEGFIRTCVKEGLFILDHEWIPGEDPVEFQLAPLLLANPSQFGYSFVNAKPGPRQDVTVKFDTLDEWSSAQVRLPRRGNSEPSVFVSHSMVSGPGGTDEIIRTLKTALGTRIKLVVGRVANTIQYSPESELSRTGLTVKG